MRFLAGHVIRDHVLIGAIPALLLIPVFGPWGSLLFWLANIGIDADHYVRVLTAFRGKLLGLRALFEFHSKLVVLNRREDFLALEIFHTAEFMALTGIVCLVLWPALQPVFWGMLFHVLVDFVHLARMNAFTKRAHSVTEYLLRRRNLLRRGLSPDWLWTGEGVVD